MAAKTTYFATLARVKTAGMGWTWDAQDREDSIMLHGNLLHPRVLSALGAAGHGSLVLIADGNYPFSTKANPSAERVYLNLAPDLLQVTDALRAVASATPVESADVMIPDDSKEPMIFGDFRQLLPGVALTKHGRFDFYDLAMGRDICLVIATADTRLFANIAITIGCR